MPMLCAAGDKPIRRRRTYSCGPCQRYKTKCNLRTPCESCQKLNRTEKCLNSPPHPPKEEEKVLILQRRLRLQELKRKMSLRLSESVNEAIACCTCEAETKHDSKRKKVLDDPICSCNLESPPFDSTETYDILKDTIQFFAPSQRLQFVKREQHFSNIQEYSFLKNYHKHCSLIWILLPKQKSVPAFRLGRSITRDSIITLVSEFATRDVSGVVDLIDIEEILLVAVNFSDYCDTKDEESLWRIDVNRIEILSLASLIFSQGFLFLGDLVNGRAWLSLSCDLRLTITDSADIANVISLGIWTLLYKTPSLMANNIPSIVRAFDKFFARVAQFPKVAKYFTKDEDTNEIEIYNSAARVLVLIKTAETEVNALGLNGSLQRNYRALRNTVQPDRDVLKKLFTSEVDQPISYDSRFHIMLYVCGRYFRRFEKIEAPRDLIHSYLLLHQEVGELDSKVSERIRLNLASNQDISKLSSQFYDLLMNLLLLKFFFIRLLVFVKLEDTYFPSLRFAHYVTSLMCVFNWILHLGFITKLPLEIVFEKATESSYFVDIMLLYLCCGFQAVFLAVFTNFSASNSNQSTIDISYLNGVISRSMTKVLRALSHVRYSQIGIISHMLEAIQQLCSYISLGRAQDMGPEEFIQDLRLFMTPENWDTLISNWFGGLLVCKDHIHLLWRLASFIKLNKSQAIYITRSFFLDTKFFFQFEHLPDPIRFPPKVIDSYLQDVVDRAETYE